MYYSLLYCRLKNSILNIRHEERILIQNSVANNCWFRFYLISVKFYFWSIFFHLTKVYEPADFHKTSTGTSSSFIQTHPETDDFLTL
jgi:hypothetical protein